MVNSSASLIGLGIFLAGVYARRVYLKWQQQKRLDRAIDAYFHRRGDMMRGPDWDDEPAARNSEDQSGLQ